LQILIKLENVDQKRRDSLVAEPETDFNATWPSKVIQGHLFQYHWRATKGLQAQYNKCGLRCEGSEDISPFSTTPLSFDAPSPLSSEPPRISAKTYLSC